MSKGSAAPRKITIRQVDGIMQSAVKNDPKFGNSVSQVRAMGCGGSGYCPAIKHTCNERSLLTIHSSFSIQQQQTLLLTIDYRLPTEKEVQCGNPLLANPFPTAYLASHVTVTLIPDL